MDLVLFLSPSGLVCEVDLSQSFYILVVCFVSRVYRLNSSQIALLCLQVLLHLEVSLTFEKVSVDIFLIFEYNAFTEFDDLFGVFLGVGFFNELKQLGNGLFLH